MSTEGILLGERLAIALILLLGSRTSRNERDPIPHAIFMTDIYNRRILRSRAVGNRKAGDMLKKLWQDRQAGFRAKLRNCCDSGAEKTDHEFHELFVLFADLCLRVQIL